MAQSGPEGFVVARIGVPVAWTDFERLIEVSAVMTCSFRASLRSP